MQDIKTIIVRNELKAYVMEKRAEQRELEERYNPYHDPKNGRFTNSGYGGGIGDRWWKEVIMKGRKST